MKKIAIFGGATILALGLGAAAFAFDPPAQGHGGGHGRHGGMLRGADANGDGQITRAEADAARAQAFTRMDVNGDGVLNEADREARREAAAARRAERGQRPGRPNLDRNGDGAVTREEFLAGDMTWFTRADTNNNGVVEASEIEAMRAAMGERRRARRQNQE